MCFHLFAHAIRQYISGEDAYLGSQLVPEYVKGVQSQKVIANIKCAIPAQSQP